jgi:RNA polymerase sigma factor (sigma-70 family)
MFLKQKFRYRTYSSFDMPYLKKELTPFRYTKDQEEELIRKKCKGDSLARQRLVEGALEMVQSIVAQYDHCKEPLEELVSEGTLGLLKAVDKVSDKYNNRFSAFASWYVHSAISQYLDKRGFMRLPTTLIREVREYLKTKESLSKKDLPTGKYDLARAMNVSLKKIEEWDKAGLILGGYKQEELAKNSSSKIGGQENIFGGKKDKKLQRIDEIDFIKIGLGKIDKKVAYVIASLLGLDTPRKSIAELASELKLSQERIRQYRKQGIRELKKNNA